MKTISVCLYQFDELDIKAKEVAREWFKKDYPDHGWWKSVYDEAKEIATRFGIEIKDINFSGFWSQGDGACFTGMFRTTDLQPLKRLKEGYPTELQLHALLERLHVVDRAFNTMQRISIGVRGHYSHSGTMTFDNLDDEYTDAALGEVSKCLRSFADWIYASLEKEYEYLTSNECVDETIRANEYWFLVDGSRSTLGDD